MLRLPHGCYCSQLSVFPKNWKTISASVKKNWYIHYRFYDPSMAGPDGPKCRQVFIKGMNKFKTQSDRRASVEALIEHELHMLKREGYNPITETMLPENHGVYCIDLYTPFIKALEEADKKLEVGKTTHRDIGHILKFVKKAAIQLGIVNVPVSRIRRKDIRAVLDRCREIKPYWSANTFNHYRAHLMMLFKKIVEYEAIDQNPVREIAKEKTVKTIRVTPTIAERKKIDEHLKTKVYTFWRFMHIFFHSGARETELMRLKAKDVDLVRQRYKSVIKKGKQFREVERTIKDVALPLWKELLDNCRADDFLFSKFLKPGPVPIPACVITKRWKKYVKEELEIKADFYSLKHLNTSETVDALDEQAAAQQNAHTSTAMVIGIYDTRRNERQHERLKGVNNSFFNH